MPSRFTFIAMALAAPLLLAACEQEAQQEAEVGQAEEPPAAETQTAEPDDATQPPPGEPPATAEQQPATAEQQPATAEQQPQTAGGPSGQPAPEVQGQAGEGEGDGAVVVVPPEEEVAQNGERQTDQAPEEGRPAAQAPGEPAPEAAGVASVAAYVGRWAEEERMCRQSYWIFTNLRLETPDDTECDIQSTEELEDGIALHVACTEESDPLAEPERGTMSLTFPNLPQTDTMAVSGGPVEDQARTLGRCPRG